MQRNIVPNVNLNQYTLKVPVLEMGAIMRGARPYAEAQIDEFPGAMGPPDRGGNTVVTPTKLQGVQQIAGHSDLLA